MSGPVVTFRDSRAAFDEAIASGRLSEDEASPVFAGLYMYMGTNSRGGDMFKHSVTRRYLSQGGES